MNVQKLKGYLKTLSSGTEFQVDYLPTFNSLVGGFERKKLIVIGARTSEGKSMFSLQMAYELSLKHKVLFLSIEMTVESAMFRLLCYQQKIQNTDIYKGRYYDHESLLKGFNESLVQQERFLIFTEEIGRTWEQIVQVIEALDSDMPDIIFLDHIQLITTAGKKMEAIEDYIKKFREMAIKKNFCLFVCSQINRQNISENKEPSMEGLKSTGLLEEAADKVILLYYPCKRSPNIDHISSIVKRVMETIKKKSRGTNKKKRKPRSI